MKKEYPYQVQVIKTNTTLRKYCRVFLWSKWIARIEHRYTRHKIPVLLTRCYIKKPDSPRGETLMYACELKFIDY